MKRRYLINRVSITDDAVCPCDGAIYSKTFRDNKLAVHNWLIELDDILEFVKKIGCNVIVSQKSESYDKEGNEYPEITIYDDMVE